jgi:hypothetical protein
MALQLKDAGMRDIHFHLLLSGRNVDSRGSLTGYASYCEHLPTPRFLSTGPHVVLAKRMELVLHLHRQGQFAQEHSMAFVYLAQAALVRFPSE